MYYKLTLLPVTVTLGKTVGHRSMSKNVVTFAVICHRDRGLALNAPSILGLLQHNYMKRMAQGHLIQALLYAL